MITGKRLPRLIKPVRKKQAPTPVRPATGFREKTEVPKTPSSPKDDFESVEKTYIYSTHKGDPFTKLNIQLTKPLSEVPPKDARSLFRAKCVECTKICNFADSSKDLTAKINKTTLFKHIISGFQIPHIAKTITPDTYHVIYQMLSANLFRAFPDTNTAKYLFTDLEDAAWPHVSLAYEVLQASLQVSAEHIPPRFAEGLARNCASPDLRERPLASAALVELQQRGAAARGLVRRAVVDCLTGGVCSSELLDAASGIIASLSAPLRADGQEMFSRAFLPLHASPGYCGFSFALTQAVSRFASKSGSVLSQTVRFVDAHWPVSDRAKQAALLRELDDLAGLFGQQSPDALAAFLARVGRCAADPCASVAAAALRIAASPGAAKFARGAPPSMLALVTGAHEAMAHWDGEVRAAAEAALQALEAADPAAFRKCVDAQKMMRSRRNAAFAHARNGWMRVAEAARAADPGAPAPDLERLR